MTKMQLPFLQYKRLAGALILTLPLGPLTFTTTPVQAGASASANLSVTVQVIASAKLQTEYQASHIRITSLDIARGYVTVAGATRILASTGSYSGFRLEFHPVGHLFESVQIDGLSYPVQLGADGGSSIQRNTHASNQTYSLNYRFMLPSDTIAGEYSWPLQISASSI
jgi:hypothetical protein